MPPPQPAIPRPQVAGAAANAGTLPIVRIGYIIPSNRTAQANAAAKLRRVIIDDQNWFRDQMDRHGFGPKTFRFETEADGVTPMVHIVNVPETDDYLRADPWGHTLTAATNAGITVWASGEVWVLVPEAHMEAADGTVSGGAFLGASAGGGNGPGVAVLGSDCLARCGDGMDTDDRNYDGLSIPEIGPFPLKQDLSFQWFEGTTISSVSSSARGASAHEMSHAFGLPHDFRNDTNYHGDLMGNGLRGFRGNFYPARYATNYTRLSYASALALNVSRYFNADTGETAPPSLTVATSGPVEVVNGQIGVSFTASDPSGLAAAWLALNGNLVAELPLTGTTVSTRFSIPYFTPGTANTYTLVVFDRWGNRQSADTTITPTAGPNCAPQPFFQILSPVPLAGETVVLDASGSTDPDSDASLLKVEWDLDGDGVFDTAPTTTKTFNLPLPAEGTRYVVARISDPSGASAVSAPIALHVHRPLVTVVPIAPNPTLELNWLSKLGFSYQLQSSDALTSWSATGFLPLRGNGGVLRPDVVPPTGTKASFYSAVISKANN